MSKIIVFEGADRCGKATQSQLLKEYIESIGKKAIVIEVPVENSFFYDTIYWMLKNGLAKKFPNVFQLVNFINKWIFQTMKLTELEHEYDFIIFDRWSLSAVVYGTAEGLDQKFCDSLYKMLRKPDFTVMLLGKPYRNEAEDVYESDDFLQSRVRELYTQWSDNHPRESYVLSASDVSKEKLASEILSVLRTFKITPI